MGYLTIATKQNDSDQHVVQDPMDAINIKLKGAREQLIMRQIRNEDLKLSVAEGGLMPTSLHREALNEIVSATVTFMETLPDVLERQLALPGPIVGALRKAVDSARDNLYEKLLATESMQLSGKAQPNAMPSAPSGLPKKRGRPTNAERAARAAMTQ